MVSTEGSKTCCNVEITGIQDRETIYYQLLLLKGNTHHEICKKRCKLTLLVKHGETIESVASKHSHDKFKSLVELKPGENNITIQYCCSSLSLTVTYSRRQTKLNVVPIYIINEGHDGKFQAPDTETNTPENACTRILTGCKLLQCLLAEKMREAGLERRTFQLDSDKCLVFYSGLHIENVGAMTQDDLWMYLGREIMSSDIGRDDKKYLGFLSCTKYCGTPDANLTRTYEDVLKLTAGHVALGGGGLALFGSACLYTWPENVFQVVRRFEDQRSVDTTKFMDDSCYRGTTGGCFSTTLGSVLHELCHTFDLGHTEDGIMGRGFDDIHNFFINFCDSESTKVNLISNDATVRIKVKEKSSNTIIRNSATPNESLKLYHTEDKTYFTKSCLTLLYYHRYFNDCKSNRTYVLRYDRNSNLMKSTAGIRVVEIRTGVKEMVRASWTFTGKILKYSFQIPPDCLGGDVTLVAEDNVGNILKEFCTKM